MTLPDSIGHSIRRQVPLAPYTTFKIGGPAEYLFEAESLTALKEALMWANNNNIPVTILGGGSNVLVDDAGVCGLVIIMRTKGIEVTLEGDNISLTVAAGEVWDDVVNHCVKNRWWGIENLSAIPGSMGAFPIQNVGAYGVEAKDVIMAVTAIHKKTLKEKKFTNDDCKFLYRDSFFKHGDGTSYVVTSVTLRLSSIPWPHLSYKDLMEYFKSYNETPTLSEIQSAVRTIRARKFPNLQTFGTAGSFFKNPVIPIMIKQQIEAKYPGAVSYVVDENSVKLSAAWLIDNVLQLRGARAGEVGTYQEQALVVINYGGASARDIKMFTKNIQESLYKKINVMLEQEVQNIF